MMKNVIIDTDLSIFTSFELYNGETNMTEYNYTTYCGDEDGTLRSFTVTFEALFYSLLFLLGVVGNGLMMTVLLSRRRLLRISEIYLLHLAAADLLLLATFPFAVLESASGWVLGHLLCKLTATARQLNLLCGSFLLGCIGVDRYLAVVHAVANLQHRRRRTVHLTCLALWLVCLAISVPNLAFFAATEDRNTPRLSCSSANYGVSSHNWVLTIRVLEHVCFFLPLAVMGYCYSAVVVTLFKSPRGHTQQGAIRLALLITLVFCACWLPYNVILVAQTAHDLSASTDASCESLLLLQGALAVAKGLGFSHCCLNPFLYAFVGVHFRNDLLRLMSNWGCDRVCPRLARAPSRASASDTPSTTLGHV